jgi:Tfp pilus assembly protein PilF
MLLLKFVSLLFCVSQLILTLGPTLAVAQEIPLDSSARTLYSPTVRTSSRGIISGTVNFPDQTQISPQVIVTVRCTTSSLSRSVLTDSSGHFEFSDLPNGAYVVSVDEGGYSSTVATAFVDGVHGEVPLTLRPVVAPPSPVRSAATVSVRELKVPEKARDSFKKGLRQLNKGNYAASVPFFAKAIDKYPRYYEAYYHLGLADAHLGHMDSAANCFQSAVNLSGGHYPWAEFAFALILSRQGHIVDADRLATDGLEQDQSTPDGYVVMAVIRLHEERVDEAEKNAQEALARNSHQANAYLILADIHAKRKDYASETKDLDTYLSLNPEPAKAEYARDLRSAAQRLAAEDAAKQSTH